MNRHRNYTALAFACWLLTACASLGLPAARDITDRIAYANGNVTAIATSATNSFNAGRISADDARYVSTLAKESAALLDAAEAAATAGDVIAAEGRLELAQSVLTSLEAYLTSKEKQL